MTQKKVIKAKCENCKWFVLQTKYATDKKGKKIVGYGVCRNPKRPLPEKTGDEYIDDMEFANNHIKDINYFCGEYKRKIKIKK